MRAVLLISLLALAVPAFAQTADEDAQAAREEAELRVEADMVKMNNLAEAMAKNLGQLHYLRTLCYGTSDQKWRDYASQMMQHEARNDQSRRSNLIRAFNTGFYLEQDRHSTCSEALAVDVAALSENGRHLAGMLGDPYREN